MNTATIFQRPTDAPIDGRQIDCPIDIESALAICRDRACDHEPATWDMAARVLRQYVEPGDREQPNGDAAAQLCEIKAQLRRMQMAMTDAVDVNICIAVARACQAGVNYEESAQ